MKVQKFLPSSALTRVVKEFIFIDTNDQLFSSPLPGTSLVMSFRLSGSIKTNLETLPVSVVSGLRQNVREFHYSTGTSNILVVFHEGAFTNLIRIPANEFFNSSISTEDILGRQSTKEILDRLSCASVYTDRIAILEQFIAQRSRHVAADLLVEKAIDSIRLTSGTVRIKDLAASLHISQDAFEKRFRKHAGSTAKQFATIVRLRNLISRLDDYPSLTDAAMAAGYFDQAHFIKDFKFFTGRTPSDFLKNQSSW